MGGWLTISKMLWKLFLTMNFMVRTWSLNIHVHFHRSQSVPEGAHTQSINQLYEPAWHCGNTTASGWNGSGWFEGGEAIQITGQQCIFLIKQFYYQVVLKRLISHSDKRKWDVTWDALMSWHKEHELFVSKHSVIVFYMSYEIFIHS